MKPTERYYHPRWEKGEWRNGWEDRMADSLAAATKKSTAAIDRQLRKYYKTAMQKTIADFESTLDKLQATMAAGQEATPADLYKLDKYWQIQGQLKHELQKLGDKQAALFSKRFEEQFFEVYYSLPLQSQAAFATLETATAQQMIMAVWCADGKAWSQRIWDNIDLLQETLNEELVHCVAAGKKTTELKKLLQERFAVSHYSADRIARTEIAHIQTQAAQKRYEDSGIQYVQIWADKDERRCDICGKLHKKQYPVGAAVPIPAHPNCRCAIIPVVE